MIVDTMLGRCNSALFALLALFALSLLADCNASNPCALREFPEGYVCVCNETYCDSLDEPLTPWEPNHIIVVSTSAGGLRFNVANTYFEPENRDAIEPVTEGIFDSETEARVNVDQTTTFQHVVGFGGAFTGAVSYLLEKLPQSLQDAIYNSYYSPTAGIGYTMMRIPIGGCDFDLAPWAYNEQPEHDTQLSNFTQLDRRDLDRITQIQRLRTVSGQSNVKFVGTAWSPPKWMKSNNAWTGLSHLLPEYYQTWAEYHLRYLELMQESSVDFWAITTGNEPLNGVLLAFLVPFMSLGWTPDNQGIWVGENLGPVLRQSKMSHVKLLGGDDQRYVFPWWFTSMQSAHTKSIDLLDGFAVHFYANTLVSPERLDQTREMFPDKLILNTESCAGALPTTAHLPLLGSWTRTEYYIDSYFEDLKHSVNGWIDWNLILDLTGGPNYVNNTVDAPIVSNSADNEIYKQPMFYAIGHFSRFVIEDSVRIDVTSTNPQLHAIGFKRPDGFVALLLHNKAEHPIRITVNDAQRKNMLTVPAKSIHTLVY